MSLPQSLPDCYLGIPSGRESTLVRYAGTGQPKPEDGAGVVLRQRLVVIAIVARQRTEQPSRHRVVLYTVDARELLIDADQDGAKIVGAPVLVLTKNQNPISVSDIVADIAVPPDPTPCLRVECPCILAQDVAT